MSSEYNSVEGLWGLAPVADALSVKKCMLQGTVYPDCAALQYGNTDRSLHTSQVAPIFATTLQGMHWKWYIDSLPDHAIAVRLHVETWHSIWFYQYTHFLVGVPGSSITLPVPVLDVYKSCECYIASCISVRPSWKFGDSRWTSISPLVLTPQKLQWTSSSMTRRG